MQAAEIGTGGGHGILDSIVPRRSLRVAESPASAAGRAGCSTAGPSNETDNRKTKTGGGSNQQKQEKEVAKGSDGALTQTRGPPHAVRAEFTRAPAARGTTVISRRSVGRSRLECPWRSSGKLRWRVPCSCLLA